MPRPSKRVAPDTLGGRLRAARQSLRFSLAEVAGDKYSTSLISQIERNRVDPSMESLEYLSERLKLPLEDLRSLARQHRESETEANLSKAYEEKYAEINLLLANHQSAQALEDLRSLDIVKLPIFLRWRTLAQRGESYFEQRKFSEAQRDFQSALTILPTTTMPEYPLQIVKLRLHLAASTRELNQLEQAREYYHAALAEMNGTTPLLYIAQAHWGLALVYQRLAQGEFIQSENESNNQETTRYLQQKAWQHAMDACTLYHSISDTLNAALLQCQLALIEQALGDLEQARKRLHAVLETWKTPSNGLFQSGPGDQKSTFNVISAAACYLAGVEMEAEQFEAALANAHLAVEAGKRSYTLRQAEAFMRLGEVLETDNSISQETEDAFRQAVDILKHTERVIPKIQAHYRLGRYLMRIGRTREGQNELEKAYKLTGVPRGFSNILPSDERAFNNM